MAVCTVAPSSCNLWLYQSNAEQRFLLMQLLNALLNSPHSLSTLKNTDSQPYWCQGSTAKIKTLQAQQVASRLTGVTTAQPVCWTPQQVEGAIAFLYCSLLNQLGM